MGCRDRGTGSGLHVEEMDFSSVYVVLEGELPSAPRVRPATVSCTMRVVNESRSEQAASLTSWLATYPPTVISRSEM